MSQQGGSPTGHQDDWWGQLYDAPTDDTGPAPTTDSLDDRFASAVTFGTDASGAVDPEAEEWWETIPRPRGTGEAGAGGAVEGLRGPEGLEGFDEPGDTLRLTLPRQATPQPPSSPPSEAPPPIPTPPPIPSPIPSYRAPWEPPPETPSGPTNFPPGPLPPGFAGPPEPDAPTTPGSVPAPKHRPLDTPPAAPLPPPPPSALDAYTAPKATAPPRDVPEEPPAPGTASASGPPEVTDGPPAPQAPPTLTAPRPLLTPYVGSGPPTYDANPTALPLADPDALEDLVADTVLDGARYGSSTVRAVSLRGDSARYRGEPRRDALLTARFGYGEHALVLVAMATGARATVGAHKAAAEVCRWIGRAVGRSHVRLAEDIRAGRRGDLKSGLHRLTDRSLGRLRAGAAEQGLTPQEYTATLRCLLLPADPECRTRVFFGVGDGGLFRLRAGEWQDIEPAPGEPGLLRTTSKPLAHTPPEEDGVSYEPVPGGPYTGGPYTPQPPPAPYDQLPPPDPFLFRTSLAQPGDTLLMCTGGLADPLRGELEFAGHLTARWSGAPAPGLAEFLADVQIRVKGYADDRTAAAIWDA